ncbi:hypothetical protein L345_11493, partial [Ophiophagus hannah]
MEALTRLHITVSKAYKINPEMNFEVFIHKVDGLSDDHKIETQRDIHQRANDDLADAGLEKLHLRQVKCLGLLTGFSAAAPNCKLGSEAGAAKVSKTGLKAAETTVQSAVSSKMAHLVPGCTVATQMWPPYRLTEKVAAASRIVPCSRAIKQSIPVLWKRRGGFYLTSIYDHSIFEAFSKVVQKLIPQLPTLENLLNIFISVSSS